MEQWALLLLYTKNTIVMIYVIKTVATICHFKHASNYSYWLLPNAYGTN